MRQRAALPLPVVSQGAELLVQGYLMRRNILAYRAPPNNEGYDLICIHPDPRANTKLVRVQVKSRYQTDCDRCFPIREESFGAFDYLVAVFLNIGYYYKKRVDSESGRSEPEFYTLPVEFVKEHHIKTKAWEKIRVKGREVEYFRNDAGFELIATDLGIPYPSREAMGEESTAHP